MDNTFYFKILFFVFSISISFLFEYLYIYHFAKFYKILDIPNQRSSHGKITIRGGGIIFPIVCFASICFKQFPNYIEFSISLVLVSYISYLDDLKGLSSVFRLFSQIVIIVFTIFSMGMSLLSVVSIVCFLFSIALLNVYNFMDGINGITALYSFVTIGFLFWINQYVIVIVPDLFFLSVLAALFAFSFYNMRKNALCFAGDVGSVSMAFIIFFLLVSLIKQTGTFIWVASVGIYFIDTAFTIFCRILRREKLLEAHRSHFYQYLANEARWTHIQVSILFAAVQLLLNISVVYSYITGQIWVSLLVLLAFTIIYTIFRFRFEGHKRLFVTYNPA
ncbi:glycosyltransferase family 4 protein [Sediminibacterium sp. KACHI17]|uniref:Glycosyltransferase family 4 protein n=1 Tax=Sediminibacterium sp. KACHI17 TaxID=1751071 RepID=A0AAT9GIA5_9BACT